MYAPQERRKATPTKGRPFFLSAGSGEFAPIEPLRSGCCAGWPRYQQPSSSSGGREGQGALLNSLSTMIGDLRKRSMKGIRVISAYTTTSTSDLLPWGALC